MLTRPTDNCYVSLICLSTWSTCITQLRRHVARLSSVIKARYRTSCSAQWVNCLAFVTVDWSRSKCHWSSDVINIITQTHQMSNVIYLKWKFVFSISSCCIPLNCDYNMQKLPTLHLANCTKNCFQIDVNANQTFQSWQTHFQSVLQLQTITLGDVDIMTSTDAMCLGVLLDRLLTFASMSNACLARVFIICGSWIPYVSHSWKMLP